MKCLKSLWCRLHAYHQLGSSATIPSNALTTFHNKYFYDYLTRVRSDATVVMGRCLQALVVKLLVAGLESSTRPDCQIRDNDGLVRSLSANLRADNDDVALFLECPGTVELATMCTILFGGRQRSVYSSDVNLLPSEVRDVAQQTLAILSQTANLQLDQPIAQLDISDMKFIRIVVSGLRNLLQRCILSSSTLRTEVRRGCLQISLKCLWEAYHKNNQNEYQSFDESEPSSAYFFSTLGVASPEFIQLCQTEQDRNSRVMGRCMGTLAVMRLMTNVRSRSDSGVQIGNDELAYLSIMLGTGSDDVKYCLEWPDIVELAIIASLALGDFGSLGASFGVQPFNPGFNGEVREIANETLTIISRAILAENTVGPQLINWGDIFNGKLARMVVYFLHNVGGSDRTANVRRSCLRMCLRSLWYCAKAYHQPGISEPLPSYFPSTLASPEIIRLIQIEPDPATRVMGQCFGVLVVMKLAADIRSRADLNPPTSDEELACLSAILPTDGSNLKIWFSQPCAATELANIISLICAEIDFLFSDTAPSQSEVLDMMQQTHNILTRTLPAELKAKLTNFTDSESEVNFYRVSSISEHVYQGPRLLPNQHTRGS